jgi:hypothetical protein
VQEAENWKLALRFYKGHPIPPLLLAYQLITGKANSFELSRKGIRDAIAG